MFILFNNEIICKCSWFLRILSIFEFQTHIKKIVPMFQLEISKQLWLTIYIFDMIVCLVLVRYLLLIERIHIILLWPRVPYFSRLMVVRKNEPWATWASKSQTHHCCLPHHKKSWQRNCIFCSTEFQEKYISTPSLTPDDDVFKHLALTYSTNHPTMNQGCEVCQGMACKIQKPKFYNGTTNGAEWYPLTGKNWSNIIGCTVSWCQNSWFQF